MTELVQLDGRREDFGRRGARVVVASMEGVKLAEKTRKEFPSLLVLADESRGLSEAAGVVHPRAGPDEADIDMPTTIVVDRRGIVRWIYRSPSVVVRLAPDALLREVERLQK